MKIIIPDDVRAALAAADMAEAVRYCAKRAVEEAESARLRRIAELRLARHEELQECAEAVFAWRQAFAATEEAARIWRYLGDRVRLTIFVAKFWRGEPAPAGDRTTWAVLSFEGWRAGSFGLPPFWYEERYKGHGSFEARLCHQHELIDGLHPDFLAALRAHLEGPDAWKFILQDLERFTKR